MASADLLWPLTALLGAAGLHAIAPRRAPLIYLGPAVCTTIFIAIAAAYVALIWSH